MYIHKLVDIYVLICYSYNFFDLLLSLCYLRLPRPPKGGAVHLRLTGSLIVIITIIIIDCSFITISIVIVIDHYLLFILFSSCRGPKRRGGARAPTWSTGSGRPRPDGCVQSFIYYIVNA